MSAATNKPTAPSAGARRGSGVSRALNIVAGLVLLFLVFPILVVIPVSFSAGQYLSFPPPGFSLQWYENFFNRRDWVDSAILSLWVGLVVMCLATVLGTAASLGLVRGRFRGRQVVNMFLVSPLVVPVIIVAIGIYFFYSRIGVVGNPFALVLAHTAIAVPFVIINVSATLYGFDERLEHAAMSLGASRWQTFRQVTLPLISPGVMAGALFAFITSFDELIIALFVSGTGAVTLPRKMWNGIRFEIDPTIAAVSTLLIVFTGSLFISAELLRRRSENLRTRSVDEGLTITR